MKRSLINQIMQSTLQFLEERKFYLPPFAYWTPDEWAQKGREAHEIVDNKLGWDITDFGRGKYDEFGLFLFTMRNGSPKNAAVGKPYCEKILIVQPNQRTPMHFHWNKMEDIINRGGGTLLLRLYNASTTEELDETSDVIVSLDGVQAVVPAGGLVELKPGESITLRPYCYHEFWSPDGTVLIGEVSLVNDDDHDNRFADPVGRFPAVEEDQAPLHLLVNDYPRYAPNVYR